MAKAPKITIDELEAKYPLYCKALKLLVKEARAIEDIKRSLCWDRLALLHRSLPAHPRPSVSRQLGYMIIVHHATR